MSDPTFESESGDSLVEEVREGRLTRADLIRRAALAGLSVSAVDALLQASGAAAAPLARDASGRIRVAMITTGALDPVRGYDFGSLASAQAVGDYLIWIDPGNKLRPVLATSWKSDQKATTWTFKLRPGVHFSNGRPFTATDVVATFDRLTDPSVANATLKGILSKGNTKRVNALTVSFHLDRPFVDFPVLVSVANYNSVILPATFSGDFEKSPIGTGPFVLTGIVPKQSVTFRRNRRYWRKNLPRLNEVDFRFYAETQAQVLALQGGDVDMMIETPFQGAQPLFSNSHLRILSTPSNSHRAFHMRIDQKPWHDKRVRQALAFSIDRQKLVKILYKGRAVIGNDHIFGPALGYHLPVPQRKQDYPKAKRLLAAAGYPRGLKVTLTTENYNEVPALATIVKEMAKPTGFDIELNIMDQDSYYGSGSNQPWLDANFGLVDWGNRPIASPYINTAYRCGGIWNGARWCNKRYTALAVQFDATVDRKRRLKIATEMARIQQDATPTIIPYWVPRLRAVSKKVHGVKPDPSGNLDLSRASVS